MTSRRSNTPGQPLMHWNHALYAIRASIAPRPGRDPIVLGGPGGERRIGLLEPQTLYYAFLAGAEHFKLWTAGWKEDLAARPTAIACLPPGVDPKKLRYEPVNPRAEVLFVRPCVT